MVVLQRYFNETTKLKRCTKILQDVEDPREQYEILNNYHVGKCNHIGITKTLLELSQIYY
jgi:hypothetical protein